MSRTLWRLLGLLLALNLVSIEAMAHGTEGQPSALQLKTKCVLVRDSGIFGSAHADAKTGVLSTGQGSDNATCAGLGADARPLIGTGDLIIAVDKTAFEQAQKAMNGVRGHFLLFLNGIPLPTDALLVGSEEVDSYIVLRFRIQQGAETQRLWSVLYADGALFEPHDLFAALGWRSVDGGDATMIPVRPQATSVSITTGPRLTIALLLVLLSIGAITYIGVATDTLRDAPDSMIPAWWQEAKELRERLSALPDDTARDAYLATEYPNTYDVTKRAKYEHLARSALAGETPSNEDVVATKFGLALLKIRWEPLRASYSLSRTQMALWFTFAVATGLFLWLLYGDLRRIDGSLLALLGISVSTAGVSWVTDRNADSGRPYVPSCGFWYDLLTGFDERKQLHRYQAVVVNILLLVVGVFHVQQQLSYPVFDPTWLIFLGISGTAYGVGKQVLENK